ncbi:hypothetical protein C5O23_04970 [Duncaniella muris]|uniref:Uncharacterized protein n=1 Tax=Duncaniella muris TaxID=2094150 RepID=A0A2V1IR51_9BACT|nr:hypothetical protein C5O23_04970 [Duncaniella muris]ROS98053.1 hypothetical protein EEL37_05230 [Muribaculaceae bacterium Isolate-077 (Janvier)]ROT01284.1 hypothetical protein EEL41_05725 [Muribaculaceae bacterium Isolate-084 (Janvier)]
MILFMVETLCRNNNKAGKSFCPIQVFKGLLTKINIILIILHKNVTKMLNLTIFDTYLLKKYQ